jgi:hypothetical protein
MAGLFVIGNAVNTLFIGQVNHLGLFWVLLIELFVILFAAYLFLHLHSVAAEVLGILLMGLPLCFLTVYIFEANGTVINVIFTMLGIAAHRFVSGIEDMFSARGKKHHKHKI